MYFIAIWVSCCLFCSWFLFLLHRSTAGQWKKKKKAKTQEGSLRNSVNFCTIPVALSFCKMCCLTYASLVVFVLYHDIDRAVYAPVTLPSFFFFFFSWMSVQCCTCVFTLFLGCLFRCNLFFCLNVQLTNGRLYFNASLGWSFCPRYWAGATEWLEHVVLLLYATCCCFFVFLPQTMNFTLKISSISFGCTKCRCVTCVRLYICGANLHSWCMFLFF